MPPSKPPPRRPTSKPSGARPPAEAAKKTARKPEPGAAATPAVTPQRGQAKPAEAKAVAKAAKTAPNASGQRAAAKPVASPPEGEAVAKTAAGGGVTKTAMAGAKVAETFVAGKGAMKAAKAVATPEEEPSDRKAAVKTAEAVARPEAEPSDRKAAVKTAEAVATPELDPSDRKATAKTARGVATPELDPSDRKAAAKTAKAVATPELEPSDRKTAAKTVESEGAVAAGAPRLVAPPNENVAEAMPDAVRVIPRLSVVSVEEDVDAATEGAKAGVPGLAKSSSEARGAAKAGPASGEKTGATHDVRDLARALEADATREEDVPAPRVSAHPHERPPLPVGALDADVLPIAALAPLEGAFTGAPLLIHASPETIRTSGVLGTTMGRIVPGKSEGGFTFAGQARLFLRAVNRVGEIFTLDDLGLVTQATPPTGAQRCSIVLRNTSGRPIQLRLAGVVFSKYLTPQFPANARGEPFNPDAQDALAEDFTGLVDSASGKVPDPEGLFFRGPHAVLASGFLDARVDPRPRDEREAEPLLRDDLDLSQLDDVRLGTRGRLEASLTVQPGDTVLVLSARHEKGGTLQSLLDFTAVDAKGQLDVGARFRLATVSSPLPLTPDELTAISRGDHPVASAGDEAPETSAPAFPPEQGVLEAGGVFVGGRAVRLSEGHSAGDLVMSMPDRHGGAWPDAAPLTMTAREPAARTPRTHEGARGVSYALTYTLENADTEPREVELLLTSPRRHPSEHFFPQAGVLQLAMKVDGERLDVRVNQRGEGRVLACFELPPEGRREVRLEWTHAGGTFPPAGLEWRMRAG